MDFIKLWTPALALSMSLAAIPDAAEACDPSPCGGYYTEVWTSFEPLNAALIPIDGVLLLQGANTNGGPGWPDQLTLEVTLDGQPVAGALEEFWGPLVLGWRPEQPFEAGAIYKVVGTVDNPDELASCGDDIALDFTFTVDDAVSAPVTAPVVMPIEELVITPDRKDFDTLVCCEGVQPELVTEECGSATALFVDYPDGSCDVATGVAGVEVTYEITPQPETATASLLWYELLVDGEVVRGARTPMLAYGGFQFCSQIVVTNLANGDTVTTPMQCHGDAFADQVGDVMLAGGPKVTCTEPLQTCEVNANGDAWDLAKCTPWPADPEVPTTGDGSQSETGTSSGGSAGEDDLVDKGCACDGGDAGGPGALGLLGLLGLGLVRRRRGVGAREQAT